MCTQLLDWRSLRLYRLLPQDQNHEVRDAQFVVQFRKTLHGFSVHRRFDDGSMVKPACWYPRTYVESVRWKLVNSTPSIFQHSVRLLRSNNPESRVASNRHSFSAKP